jgi:hypothetical protein
MSLFPETPKWGPKIGTFVVPKLWMFISFSNQVFIFGNIRIISNIPQKDLFNGV